MTRKQALSLAIQALSEKGQNEEAIGILESIRKEMPFLKWSEDAIWDAVEQFILDHGRVPRPTDFNRVGMPSHTVVQAHFGMTTLEWLEKNYPTEKLTEEEARDRLLQAFIQDYLRVKPKSARDYNANRAKGLMGWHSVVLRCGVKTWRELLEKLRLPIYNNVNNRKSIKFKVNVYTHYDFRD